MPEIIEIDASIVSRPIDTTALTYADNPQPRCPVVLLLDSSWSMEGAPIEELQAGVGQFYREMASDPIASMSVEVSIITFGEEVRQIRRFKTIRETQDERLPFLEASGMTPMGGALGLGLQEIRERRAFYRRGGFSAYKPWMILMTDGQPNDDWEHSAARARSMAEKGDLVFLGVGIGDAVDMGTLDEIVGPNPGAHRLRGLAFREFFRWLSDSLKVVSSGSTVQQRTIPDPNGYDWQL